MIRRSLIIVFVLALCLTYAAEEAPGQMSKDDTIVSVLQSHVGQKVTVKLNSGEELSGKVESVGEHLVHLSELSGKEYFDAVIAVDQVAAVIFRVRS